MTRTFRESLRFPMPRRPSRSWSRSATRRTPFARSGPRWSTRRTCSSIARARQALARSSRCVDERRPPEQGRPADSRRRLHRGRAGEVREGRAAARRHPVRDLAVQGAQGGLQRLGPVPAGRRVRHLAAVHRRVAAAAGRAHVRRVRLRALRPHLRQPRLPRHRLVRAVRVRRDPRQRPDLRRRRHLQPLCTVAADSALGARTSSSTSSGTTSPGWPTSTTPPTSPTCRPRDRRRAVGAQRHRAAGSGDAEVEGPGARRARRCRRPGTRRRSRRTRATIQVRRRADSRGEQARGRDGRALPRAADGGDPHARCGTIRARRWAHSRARMYEARGYYRPQVDCIMFTRDPVPFCAVCRRALSRVIDLYAAGSIRRFVDPAVQAPGSAALSGLGFSRTRAAPARKRAPRQDRARQTRPGVWSPEPGAEGDLYAPPLLADESASRPPTRSTTSRATA